MGSNVFGTPITTSYLMEKIKKTPFDLIKRNDRAKVAMDNKNVEGKDIAARNFAKQLHEEFGREKANTIMCLVYNGTGDPVTFYDSMFSDGEICESPCPLVIANGQWGAFLCGPDRDNPSDTDTIGAFIYQGTNSDSSKDVNWVTAFSNTSQYNSIHAVIHPAGRHDITLKTLKKKLLMINTNCVIDNTEGAAMYASIGGGRTPILEVILTLPGAFFDDE